MLVSKKWLGEYVEGLPSAQEIAEALTMHSFEIEGVEKKKDDFVIDVKVLPNRAHDCLCHRGIAKEISVVLNKKFNEREAPESRFASENSKKLEIKVDDPKLCRRYIGKRIENISIKDSPQWLKEKLEILGERSICNIVDITNYIMLDLGQPMHVFDADKVDGAIHVRLAKAGEKIILLTGEEAILSEKDLVIADDKGALAIAGIKGGKKAEVMPETRNIILESANFDPTAVRKTSQKTNIKNNSSKRFENEISPGVAEPAMTYAARLISELAGDEKTKYYETADFYPRKRNPYKVGISISELERLLGAEIKEKEVEKILERNGWQFEKIKPAEKIKSLTENLIGKSYELGASVSFDAPQKFDCSSLVAYMFSQAGISLPRISVDQYVYSKRIKREELASGDLIFTNTGNGKVHYKSVEWARDTEVPEGVDHVGLFLGEDKVFHVSRTTRFSVVEKLSESKYFEKPVGFGRVSTLNEERFVVTVPPERIDLRTKEDLVEEIGRIHGYENVRPALLENDGKKGEVNENLLMSQKIRKILAGTGYSEVYTYAFTEKGDVEIENPIASNNSFLRKNLSDDLKKALELNFKNAPLLGLDEIKIFEIGSVFGKDSEKTNVAWGIKNKKETKVNECELKEAVKKLGAEEGEDVFFLPQKKEILKFEPISPYPFVLRDIAVWTPAKTEEKEVEKIILENAGDFLSKHRLFDRFEREGRVSYAFSLVFQSQEKTLTDDEINKVMEKMTAALNSKKDWQVR